MYYEIRIFIRFFSLIIAISRSQPTYKVYHVRIESNNFLTNKYEENTDEDHRALGQKWDLFSFYEKIEIKIINEKKLTNEPVERSYEKGIDYGGKFSILQSYTENSKPYIMADHDLTWTIYKLKQFGSQHRFISLCNFNDDLIVIYDVLPIRVFFICKNTRFEAEDIELPRNIYSLLSAEHIDALGKASNNINLTYDKASYGSNNKIEYLYLFKNHVLFNPNHARDQSYNDANGDHFSQRLINYKVKYRSPAIFTNYEGYNYIIEEAPNDDGKLKIKTLKNSTSDNVNIDYVKASEFLRYEAKKIAIVNNTSKSDILYYQTVLNGINRNYIQNIINNIPPENSEVKNASPTIERSAIYIVQGLFGRKPTYVPPIKYNFNENAKVYIDLTVDAFGKVTRAVIAKGTTTSNEPIRTIALQEAQQLKFPPSQKDQQTGTILFNYYFANKDNVGVKKVDFAEEPVYTKVEIEAAFPGGDAGWHRYELRELANKRF